MAKDQRGIAITAANPDAVAAFDRVVDEFLAFGRNAGLLLKAVFEADPDMPMAHVLRGSFFNLMGNRALCGRAEKSAAAAILAAGRATPREQQHAAALDAWCRGDITRALDLWETILVEHPRDALALKLAHFHHFYRGEVAEHRDSIGRVMHAWDDSVPGYNYVLGMRAFGLEEAGDYVPAERYGRRAVELDPTDTWAIHAVAHVLEMTGRPHEGIAWINLHEAKWQDKVHNFALHVWWHRALYHLDLDEVDAVLDLYDRRIRQDTSTDDYLDIGNAAAMLLRLDFRGIDVGDRWQELGEKAEARTGDHIFPFIDAHFMMALAMTGRHETARAMLTSQAAYALAETGSVIPAMREVGNLLSAAIAAYGEGHYDRAVDLLLPVRYRVQRIGGSHAQRDVFAQLLLVSAMRAGRHSVARALAAERTALKPTSRQAWRWLADTLEAEGNGEGTKWAAAQAGALAL